MLTNISIIYFIQNCFLFTYVLHKIFNLLFFIYLFIKLLNICESLSTWLRSMEEVWISYFLEIFTCLIKRIIFSFLHKKSNQDFSLTLSVTTPNSITKFHILLVSKQ